MFILFSSSTVSQKGPLILSVQKRTRFSSTAMWAAQRHWVGVNDGVKVGRAGGGLLSIGDQILYRLPSFIGL